MAYTLRPGGRKDGARDLGLWAAAVLGSVLRGPSTLWIWGVGGVATWVAGGRSLGQELGNGEFCGQELGRFGIQSTTASCVFLGWSLGLSGPPFPHG